jgi:hypothetical protein
MKRFADWLFRLYSRSLALYPRNFRAEFAEEARDVFNLGLTEAAGEGFWGLVCFALRELYDLPLVLLALYARERKKTIMQKKLDQWFIHEKGSWAEVLLACLPFLALFLFPGVFSFSRVERNIPDPLGLALLGAMVLLLALLGIVGLLVRLPRWAMPYAGVLICLTVFLVLMLVGVYDIFFTGQISAPWWLRMISFETIFLFALVVALILVIWLARRVTLTSPFFEQVQSDWSQLSFAMYGAAMVFILGMYEDIPGAGLYILITVIPLLLGVWMFLHYEDMQRRMVALTVAITLAVGIALAANLQPLDWVSPVMFKIGDLEITRSVFSLILTWFMCEAMLFIPMLMQYIPFTRQTQKQIG